MANFFMYKKCRLMYSETTNQDTARLSWSTRIADQSKSTSMESRISLSVNP